MTEMETSSVSPQKDTDSNNDSFSLSGEDEFDSIVGTIDINEATKTYLLAEKFGNTRLSSKGYQLMQFLTLSSYTTYRQR